MTTTDFASTDREMAERVRSYAGHIEDMGDEERVLLLGYLSMAVLRLLDEQKHGTARGSAERLCAVPCEEAPGYVCLYCHHVTFLPAQPARTLGETRPGDVFYLTDQPSVILKHAALFDAQEYRYTQPGDECWYTAADIGNGMSDQGVTVVHNTKKEPT